MADYRVDTLIVGLRCGITASISGLVESSLLGGLGTNFPAYLVIGLPAGQQDSII